MLVNIQYFKALTLQDFDTVQEHSIYAICRKRIVSHRRAQS
jgi:hypothetical protein